MTEREILVAADRIRNEGIATVVLQSGEDPFYTRDRLCDLMDKIRRETGLTITLSAGEKTTEEYRDLRSAGAERYLLKYETSCPDLYRRIRPGAVLEDRLRCLADLGRLGYEVGTGNMVGIPGQSVAVLAGDLLLFQALDADMLGIGPFIPHPQTPLAQSPPGRVSMTLKVLAVARLLTRTTNIPATTALGTLEDDGRRRALVAGANVVMPDFTPPEYRRLYEIYPGRNRKSDIAAFLSRLRDDIAALGREIGSGSGGRRK